MSTQLQVEIERALWAAPEHPVVTDGSKTLSSRQLVCEIESIESALQEAGVEQGDRVLVELDRSIEFIAAIVACVRTGVTYVPISPNTPPERQEAIARHCLAEAKIAVSVRDGCRIEMLDSRAESSSQSKVESGDPLAYIIYTSGTTGSPKGVAVSHSSLWSFISSDSRIAMQSTKTCLCCASVSFDASVYEIWPTLLGGGTILLYLGDVLHVDELCDFIADTQPDRAFLTTKLFQAIEQSAMREVLYGIDRLFVGGETISAPSFSRVRSTMGRHLLAAYGPTEAVVFTTLDQSELTYEVEVPIGNPMAGKDVYVLDDHLRPCAPGEVGEIYIGRGLAEGYYRDVAMTASRFVPCPSASGDVMYRTGDLGVNRPDRSIAFRGRTDGQVKIRGYRVELGAIESFYLAQAEISNCVCILADSGGEVPRLCLYFVSPQSRINATTLRRLAASGLEGYMVPDLFVQVNEFQSNESGKIDRSSLPRPLFQRQDLGISTSYSPAENKIQELVIKLFERELRIESVGADDDFYELGGNSLTSISLLQSLADTGHAISARQLFSNSTPRSLSETLAPRTKDENAITAR